MAGPNTITMAYLNDEFSRTGFAYFDAKTRDIFFKKHFLLRWILEKGNFRTETAPGIKIVEELATNRNPNQGWRDPRAQIPLVQQDVLRTAQFDWAFYTGSIPIYDVDIAFNQSRAQIRNLLKTRIDQAVNTMSDDLSQALLNGTSNDSAVQMLGLKDAITDDTHVRPSTYGGLDPATMTDVVGWKSNLVQSNGLASIVSDMGHTLNNCHVYTDNIGAIWGDQKFYELYEDSLLGFYRTRTLEIGDASWQALDFRGIPVLWDPQQTPITATPSGGTGLSWTAGTADSANTHRAYYVDPDEWKLVQLPGWEIANPIEQTSRVPNNQFINSRLIRFGVQLICSNRRNQGMLWNVPES